MKAKLVENKIPAALKIYRFPDGTYEATRDGFLYTFLWKPYKVYNLKKIGGIGPSWIPQGRLYRNPHVQMVLQVQNGINNLNESVLDIFEELTKTFKPKDLGPIGNEAWNVVYTDLQNTGFSPRPPTYSHSFYQIEFIIGTGHSVSRIVYSDGEEAKRIWQKEALDELLDQWYAIINTAVGEKRIKSPDGSWKKLFKKILEELESIKDHEVDHLLFVNYNDLEHLNHKLKKAEERKIQLENRKKFLDV